MRSAPLTLAQRRQILAEIARAINLDSPSATAVDQVGSGSGLAEIETHLDELVNIVGRSTATTVEPYLAQIFDDICNKCPHQHPSTYCPRRRTGRCQLCRNTAAIVIAVGRALAEMGDPEYAQRHPFSLKQNFPMPCAQSRSTS
jgi:hypothetical protein